MRDYFTLWHQSDFNVPYSHTIWYPHDPGPGGPLDEPATKVYVRVPTKQILLDFFNINILYPYERLFPYTIWTAGFYPRRQDVPTPDAQGYSRHF